MVSGNISGMKRKNKKIGRFLLEWVPVSNGQGIVRNGLDMA